MQDFKTLFVWELYVSWDNFLFGVMFFLIVLGFLIVSLRSKNEGSILKILVGFVIVLFLSLQYVIMEYDNNIRDKEVWTRYQNGDFKTIVGKVEKYQEGYKNKKRYDYFIVSGVRFNSVHASPNPTNFDDKIFYKQKDILEDNITVRISYMKDIKGMLNKAIVKFEIEKISK